MSCPAPTSSAPTAPTPLRRRGGEPLSAADERDLAGAIARGDAHARERLIAANLGLVPTVARRYVGQGLDLAGRFAGDAVELVGGVVAAGAA